MVRTCENSCASFSIISPVPSGELSSQKRRSAPIFSALNSRHRRSTFSASLYVGMKMRTLDRFIAPTFLPVRANDERASHGRLTSDNFNCWQGEDHLSPVTEECAFPLHNVIAKMPRQEEKVVRLDRMCL